MRTYRTLREVEEAYLRTHPDEIESYLIVLCEAYAQDGDTAAFLSSLRTVSRVQGHGALMQDARTQESHHGA